MKYNPELAERVRAYLANLSGFQVEEKKMFGGLAFIINQKFCVNVSGDRLMCRFDEELLPALIKQPGFIPLIMKGKELKGYCYVNDSGYRNKADFEFWIGLCLAFNKKAKSSRK